MRQKRTLMKKTLGLLAGFLLGSHGAQALMPSIPCPKGTTGYEIAHVNVQTSFETDQFILENFYSVKDPLTNFYKSDFISNNKYSVGYHDTFKPFFGEKSYPFVENGLGFNSYSVSILPTVISSSSSSYCSAVDASSQPYVPLMFDTICVAKDGAYEVKNLYASTKNPPADGVAPAAARKSFLIGNNPDDKIKYLQVKLLSTKESPDIKKYKCPTVKLDDKTSYNFMGPFHYQIVSYEMKDPTGIMEHGDYLTADDVSFQKMFSQHLLKDFYTCYVPTSLPNSHGGVPWTAVYKDYQGNPTIKHDHRCNVQADLANMQDDRVLITDNLLYSSEDNVNLSYGTGHGLSGGTNCGCEFNAARDHTLTGIEDCENVQTTPQNNE